MLRSQMGARAFGLHPAVLLWVRGRALVGALVAVALLLGLSATSTDDAQSAESCPTGWTAEGAGTCELRIATPSTATVTVPPEVHSLKIRASGAAGGYELGAESQAAGWGGADGGTLAVTPGEQLAVSVGGQGGDGSVVNTGSARVSGGKGGYGGGGEGGYGTPYEEIPGFYSEAESGSGGGGGTFVYGPSGTLLIAAPGGGGAGNGSSEFGGYGNETPEGGHGEMCGLYGPDGCPEVVGGKGGTDSAGGAPGAIENSHSSGTEGLIAGTAGGGPAKSPGAPGAGGRGASADGGYETCGGGGGGGGYYGGGGGGESNLCGGGGAGSGYLNPVLNETHVSYGSEGQGVVVFRFSHASTKTEISGKIQTPFGDGLGGASVGLYGQTTKGAVVSLQTATEKSGEYSFFVEPGTYQVSPIPTNAATGGDEFETAGERCDGTATAHSCANIALASEQDAVANFSAGFQLAGLVSGAEGKGVAGATVLIQDEEQGTLQRASVVTDAEGRFKERLAPGSVTASVEALNGTEFFPDVSTDCTPSNTSCAVKLDQDRSIEFSACVVPNPDGSPLPAKTPEPIPGAVIKAPLEAVGCWTPQNGTAKTATVFTTQKPVRLDGIDVNPSPGTTITLNTAGPTVTSGGPAQMLLDGFAMTTPAPLRLAYQQGASAAGGSGVSINDLGAGTGPYALGTSVFGLPVSLGTSGPLGYGLPFVESTGQTVINGGLQVPGDTRATWNVLEGKFTDSNGNGAASLGVSGQIIASDRLGLIGQACISLNDWEPFEGELGELSGLQGCYNPAQRQIVASVMWKTPTALARFAGDIYGTAAFQNAASAATGQLQGYKLQSFQIQFDHLNTTTYTDGGLPDVRESGIPIGGGFYLQSLGGGWQNNLSTNTYQSINGTIGISAGPEFDIADTMVSLLRLDGTVAIQPPQSPGDSWVYVVAANGTIGRLTPFELRLAHADLSYRLSLANPLGTLHSEVNATLPVVGGFSGTLDGQSDNHGIALESTQTVKLFKLLGTEDLLVNADNVIPGVGGGPVNAKLADCFSTSSGFSTGFLLEFATGSVKPGCNMGALRHPQGVPATASSAGSLTFHLPPRLSGTLLAVHGVSAAPSVKLSGGRLTLDARPSAEPQYTSHALIFTDTQGKTTYIALLHPRAGAYTVRALPGSSPIDSLLESDPLAQAKLHASVKRAAGCTDSLDYRLRPAAGEQVALYAEEGSERVRVGTPHAGAGRLAVPMIAAQRGRGKVIAFYTRAGSPVEVATVARFADAASNGSESIRALRLRGGTLSWQPVCGAASYEVTIVADHKTTQLTSTKPSVTLAAKHGAETITVTAIDAHGEHEGTARRKV
jgi:hypothetical protein